MGGEYPHSRRHFAPPAQAYSEPNTRPTKRMTRAEPPLHPTEHQTNPPKRKRGVTNEPERDQVKKRCVSPVRGAPTGPRKDRLKASAKQSNEWKKQESGQLAGSAEVKGDPHVRNIHPQPPGDIVAKTSSSYPSPPSSKGSPPGPQQPTAEEKHPEEQVTAKRQCASPIDAGGRPCRLRGLVRARTPPVVRNIAADTFAPTVPNTNMKHTYAAYDDDCVPILESALIQRHSSNASLLNNPSIELKVEAVLLLERGFKAQDLGRAKDVPRKGPAKIIDDCDLYLREGKIYVATERGLLLAADYLKLAGIAETAKVRFNGLRPTWTKAFLAQRHVRRIEETTDDEEPEEPVCYPPLPPGFIGLKMGYWVEVFGLYEADDQVYGYGRNMKTRKVGWFDYAHTADINAEYPKWEGLYTPEQREDMAKYAEAQAAKKATPSPAPLASTPPTLDVAEKVAKQDATPPKVVEQQPAVAVEQPVVETAHDVVEEPAVEPAHAEAEPTPTTIPTPAPAPAAPTPVVPTPAAPTPAAPQQLPHAFTRPRASLPTSTNRYDHEDYIDYDESDPEW